MPSGELYREMQYLDVLGGLNLHTQCNNRVAVDFHLSVELKRCDRNKLLKLQHFLLMYSCRVDIRKELNRL